MGNNITWKGTYDKYFGYILDEKVYRIVKLAHGEHRLYYVLLDKEEDISCYLLKQDAIDAAERHFIEHDVNEYLRKMLKGVDIFGDNF